MGAATVSGWLIESEEIPSLRVIQFPPKRAGAQGVSDEMLGLSGTPNDRQLLEERSAVAMNMLSNPDTSPHELPVPFLPDHRYSIRIFRGTTRLGNCPPVVDGDLYNGMDDPVTTRIGEHGHR